MTKALVTGGTGFIGAALVKKLVEKGYEVSVFDNNFRGKEVNLINVKEAVRLIEGDIRDVDSVDKACIGQDVIFHLAFINGTENFYSKPDLVLDVGITGHLNAIKGSINQNIGCFVYASSSEVYQTATQIPTPENIAAVVPDVSNPRFSYGGAKLAGELLTLHYLPESVQSRIFRPHNVYGPAMGFEHVVPQLIHKIFLASQGLSQSIARIEIQGNGEETRAFCYVDDAVDGIVRVYEKGENRNVYHVGKDEETSINQLCQLIACAMGLDELHIQHGPLLSGSTLRRCPDITKIRKLGYEPAVSLSAGLRTTVDWYVDYYRQHSDSIL